MDEQKIQEELWLHPEKTRDQIVAEATQKVVVPAPVPMPVAQQATPVAQQATPVVNQVQKAQQITVDPQSPIYKTVTKMSIISLICHYVAPTVVTALVGVLSEADVPENALLPFSLIEVGAYIASWVLAISGRSKCKGNKFPTILLWIYGIEAVVGIVGGVVLILFIVYIIATCSL